MKRNLLVCTSGVSLLYLLVGLSPLKALAAEKTSKNQAINSSEKLLANKVLSQKSFPSTNTIFSGKVNNQFLFDGSSHSLGKYGILTTNETAASGEKQYAISKATGRRRIALP